MSNIRELSQLASVINVNDETKNVGIGTTNPESKLSVGGDLTASGNITAVNFYGDGSNLVGVSTFSGNYEDLTNKPEILSTVGLASEGYVDSKVGLSTSGLASVSYVDTSIVGFITSGALNGYATEEYVNNQGFVTSGIVVGFATEGYVNTSVANLVASAPETLNTLNELATALGNDANFSTTITNSLAGKANLTGANFTGVVTSTSFSGPITGNVTGNAATATKLATARTIGGVSFDGSANINLPGVNTTGNQNTSGSAATLTTGRTIAITGDLTYTSGSFNGSGNVTGTGTLATVNSNVGTFGSSTAIPSITVNAKGLVTGVTTNSITVGDGTLTLNVSGMGLTGSQTFTANQSGNATFTVTSNATSNNTNSTVVARDGSGNFSAGTITANSFSGNVTGNVNSSGVSTFVSLRSTNVNASGVTTSTGGFVGALTGDVTGNVTGNVNSSGVSTFVSLRSTNINATGIITASSFIGNASSATYATTAGVSTSVIGGIGSITSLSVSGISTLQSTTLIGSGTSTGTASQPLQVTGGTYVSGSVGIGTTRPTTALSVVGVVSATGGFNLGISSSGASITSGPVTRLNFIGAGNTFAVNGSVVDVSISGGSAVSIGTIAPSLPNAGNLWYNSNLGRTFIYYNDGDSSQWVDSAPFNIGINDRINVSGNGYILGNLGIGTTNPISKLDVRGTISIGRDDTVGINSIRSVTDINSWEYYGVFKSVAAEDTAPADIYFKDDGTKMYILGDTGNDVNEYSLSTAWDVSSATFVTTFSVAAQETTPAGLYFKPDGTRMYISGLTGVSPTGDRVYSYTLSTPWSLSSATYDSINFEITQDTAPQGVYLKNDDGTKMYVVGSTNDAVYEYSLGTAWDVSTATFTTSLLVGATNTQNLPLSLTVPVGIDFNASGTKMYIIDQTRDVVARFDLSTPWDISTAVFFDNVYIGFQELTPTGVFYQEDQSKAYIVGTTGDIVYQYNTDIPSLELASSGISTRSSIILNNEARLNNRLYVTGDTHISSPVTLKSTLQVDSSATISGTLSHTGTTGNINNTTSANTLNLATGAVGSAVAKVVNVGTGGASNSRTLITLGASTAGAISTVTVPSPTNLIIGAITPTGTASQPLQVTGGGYVSGNLGVGVTNPASKIDAYSPTSGSTAIRATSSSSFSSTLYPGVISGLSTNAASSFASQFAAAGVGATSGELGVYSFYPSFANFPADRGPRRAVDLVGGFATGTWGTEYFAINVGRNGSANDSGVLTNERFRITGTGNVGVGTTNPTTKLHVVGDVIVSGVITCTDINSTSDVNLKKNIQTFDNALNVIQNIRGVRFDWKENNKSSVGVVAQEIEKVLPELVNTGETKTVNYNGIIGVLIEAIKEQQRQIDELKKH